MTRRTLRFAIVLPPSLLALGIVFSSPVTLPPASHAAPAAILTGLVTDGGGTGMGRALVLLSALNGAELVRSGLTSAEGLYRFEGIPAGDYRVTAIKEGYESAVGRVSTWLDSRLDLILAPTGTPGVRPSSAAWILRAPRRDVLRELDAGAPLDPDLGGVIAASSAAAGSVLGPGSGASPFVRSAEGFFESLDGEIRQSFSEAQSVASSESPSPVTGGSGTATSFKVGSPLGPRARWDFLGERERETTTLDDAAIQGRQASAERVRVDVRYDTGEVGRLDMRAYYDHDALLFQPSERLSRISGGDRERRAWGYDAWWMGNVGNDASLQLDVRYLGSALGSKAVGARAERTEDGSQDLLTDVQAQTNVLKTGARLSKKFGASHRVHLGVKARVYSLDGEEGTVIAPSPGQDPDLVSEFGREGWSVDVSAAESWTILDPVSIDFGFDVSRSVPGSGRQRETIVPQVGVTFTPAPSTTVRGTVSYVATDREVTVSRATGGTSTSAGAGQMGYRVRLERRLGGRTLVVLDAQARPFSYDSIGARWESLDATAAARQLYLSDGAASVREVSLAVEARPSGTTTLVFGSSAGRVEGIVGATVPDDDLVRTLSEGSVRYVSAHLNGRSERTGTGIELDLTRLTDRSGGSEIDYADRRFALRVLQALDFLHLGRTDWSVLLAYSSYVPVRGEGKASGGGSSDPGSRTARNRVSGGVSVRF